jgi:hypothetical protein
MAPIAALGLLHITARMAILTSMAQVAISTCGSQLRSFLSLIEFDGLILHKVSILKLAKINILEIIKQVFHLDFVLFNLTDVDYLVVLQVLQN